MLRSKSKERAPDSSPAGMYMNKRQMGDYLHDLRNNRPARPSGARPPPSSFVSKRFSTSNLSSQSEVEAPPRCASAQSFHRTASAASMTPTVGRPIARPPPSEVPMEDDEILEGEDELPYLERGQRWLERQEAHSLRRALEDMDVKKEKKIFDDAQDEAAELVWKHQNPNTPYKNPDAPYKNPDLANPGYKEHLRKSSLHTRTTSWAQTAQDIQQRQMKRRSRDSSASRSVSGGSKSSSAPSSRVPSDGSLKVPQSPVTTLEEEVKDDGRQSRKRSVQFKDDPSVVPAPTEQPKGGFRQMLRNRTPSPSKMLQDLKETKSEATAQDDGHTRVSSISVAARMASNAVPAHFRNPFSRARESKGKLSRMSTEPIPATKPLDRFEIQRNPPSQSRNAFYTVNNDAESKPTTPEEGVKMKDGKEIRSDDIRKATSASLRDRSAKLPTPSMVSDSPGRPIVSFQKDWKPKEVELKQELSLVMPAPAASVEPKAYPKAAGVNDKPLPISRKKVPSASAGATMQVPSRERERTSPPPAAIAAGPTELIVPSISVSSAPPSVPTIAINKTSRTAPRAAAKNELPASLTIGVNSQRSSSRSNDARPLPTIAINEAPPPPTIAVSAPMISVSEPPARGSSTRPLPTPGRPGPRHSATAPPGTAQLRSSHITPTGYAHPRNLGAQCSTCALPIAGRIVTAAGVRFHPECFRCHHCGEGLECVAFYPEPESARLDRVNRIRDRMAGYDDVPGSAEEDGDEGLRFYCHLDYHEFFSPRCKSCKTPIEGEVVVACGAEWHVGHFFCAQCGDPFDDKTPFVEKDGYAWCVNCHTHRYSTKCKKCRKPVIDTVVRALDAEWHEQCFSCTECNGRFEDGRYFIRPGGMDPFCPACEERRLKA